MVFQNDILAGAAGAGGGYTIDQSILFNSDDTANLTRTFGTATNRKIFTFSVWVKNGKSSGSIIEYNGTGGVTWANINFGGNRIDYFDYSGGSARIDLRSTAVFRDPSAWYHVVVAMDTTQGTASNRLKFYINGTQITSFGTSTYPSLNFEGFINSAVSHLIGKGVNGPFDGYLAEYHFVDGQALAPTDFGEYNDDGVWIPKAYNGSYGNNGFYLTGETASDLGEDFSGNNNDFTSSGLATTDQMLDTPTDNFPTLNSTFDYYTSGNNSFFRPNFAVSLLSEGNLKLDTNSPNTPIVYATQSFPLSGKFYFEVTVNPASAAVIGIGGSKNIEDGIGSSSSTAMANVIGYYSNGTIFNQSSTASAYGNATAIANGEYVGVAVDIDNDAIWFCDNGTWVDGDGTASSATVLAEIEAGTTTSAAATNFLSDQNSWYPMVAAVGDYPTFTTNFGQSSFTGSAPVGFTNLTTTNLPTPAIKDGSAYFQASLYTGNGTAIGSGGKSVTQDKNSTFQPDFVWIKERNGAADHALYDAVRGTTKDLASNNSTAETTETEGLTAFDAAGFTVGSLAKVNTSSDTYVAWQWLAANSTASNSDGSITSTVSANTTSGFSIVTYTGDGNDNATVGHGLGVTPKTVWLLPRSNGDNKQVSNWETGVTAFTEDLKLNVAEAANSSSTRVKGGGSTTFTLGTDPNVNGSGNTYLAYCFNEIEGFSKFGTYTGNGSSDGVFVYCGFRPALVILRRTNSAENWVMVDSARNEYNVANLKLYADTTNADITSATHDFLSNGFKLDSSNGGVNASGNPYVFMAFAEHPFGGNGVAPVPAR